MCKTVKLQSQSREARTLTPQKKTGQARAVNRLLKESDSDQVSFIGSSAPRPEWQGSQCGVWPAPSLGFTCLHRTLASPTAIQTSPGSVSEGLSEYRPLCPRLALSLRSGMARSLHSRSRVFHVQSVTTQRCWERGLDWILVQDYLRVYRRLCGEVTCIPTVLTKGKL